MEWLRALADGSLRLLVDAVNSDDRDSRYRGSRWSSGPEAVAPKDPVVGVRRQLRRSGASLRETTPT